MYFCCTFYYSVKDRCVESHVDCKFTSIIVIDNNVLYNICDVSIIYLCMHSILNCNISYACHFNHEHSLYIADKELLPDSTFTCISNAHGTTSWLDHCVTSVTGLDNIESVTVIDEYICSDHLPLRVVIRCDLATDHHCVSGRNKNDFIDWKTAGVHDYDKFDVKSSEYLSNVDVSVSLFNCTDQSCKLHEGEIDRLYIKADRLAGDLLQHNVVDFWKNVRNLTSNKASNSTCIDVVVGEQNIADYWKSHYEGIFNSVQNTTHQNEILRKLETTEFHEDMTVTTNEVAKVIKGLKRGKAVGPDNVAAEALMHSNNRLHYLLGVCFSAMLIHGYMPQGLMDSKIIPLVKNKCGKLSDKNNYRPVAISNSLSKVYELILLDRCEEYLWTSGNQFGFKADHSTEMCIYAVHEFIDYYRSRSTNVYVTFLDASKAFDRINHWLLFDKLLKREIPLKYIVRILVYWYRTQTMYVQWDSCDSSAFKVTNGVRQGGILSPKLFIVYMDDLSDQLNNSNIGGNFGSGQLVNHISYADDMCLLSFSTAGIQKLLNICDQYSNDHDLIYNSKKTMCMCFTPKSCKSYECKLSLNQESPSYVREAR